MANIIWTPPEGWVEETGAHVSFRAPCSCVDAGKLVIGENEYDIVNAVGETVTGVGGAFASGAILDFILDCDSLNAYLQNQAFSVDRIYPVGSIYMSVNSTDPGDLFGGTWSQIQDTFLLAAGSNHAAGSTGGNETVDLSHNHGVSVSMSGSTNSATCSHKHSFSWTGSHNHSLTSSTFKPATGGTTARPVPVQNTGSKSITVSGTTGDSDNTSHSHGVSLSANGATEDALNSDVSIMPPYLAVYVWQRTA